MVKRHGSAPGTTARDRRGEAGYNLVILMVAVTVLNILVAAAIPLWRTAIRREKEEELIFRGLQYAEGIRNYQRRFGQLPVKLEQLVESKPRCMRQLWADPITGKRDWVPIRLMTSDNVDRDEERGGNRDDDEDPEGRPNEPEPGGGPARSTATSAWAASVACAAAAREKRSKRFSTKTATTSGSSPSSCSRPRARAFPSAARSPAARRTPGAGWGGRSGRGSIRAASRPSSPTWIRTAIPPAVAVLAALLDRGRSPPARSRRPATTADEALARVDR